MALYMLQVSYTSQAWAAMASHPEPRQPVFRSLCEQAGAKFIGSYYCFGDYDAVAFYDAPDPKTAAAISVAVTSAGHLKSAKTTTLLTDAEGNDTIAIRSVQQFCIGFDHRLIDGADSGKFMLDVQKTLESWDKPIG